MESNNPKHVNEIRPDRVNWQKTKMRQLSILIPIEVDNLINCMIDQGYIENKSEFVRTGIIHLLIGIQNLDEKIQSLAKRSTRKHFPLGRNFEKNEKNQEE